jgi:hypothetical protein
MASAGRILIIPKGNWKADTNYKMLDLVYHNGNSWIARTDIASGIEPTSANKDYWQQMSDMSFAQSKTTTIKPIKAGESQKYEFTYGECCFLIASFNDMEYVSMYACCGINSWSYSIKKLNEAIYNSKLGSTIGTTAGVDLNVITFHNDSDKDNAVKIIKLPFYPI